MIKAEQIPDEVLEVLRENILHDCSFKHAIAAAINAWPGAWHVDAADFEEKLILPLTQEKP